MDTKRYIEYKSTQINSVDLVFNRDNLSLSSSNTTIDGVTLISGLRVFVLNSLDSSQKNKIYLLTGIGVGYWDWILEEDYNDFDLRNDGQYINISKGNIYGGKQITFDEVIWIITYRKCILIEPYLKTIHFKGNKYIIRLKNSLYGYQNSVHIFYSYDNNNRWNLDIDFTLSNIFTINLSNNNSYINITKNPENPSDFKIILGNITSNFDFYINWDNKIKWQYGIECPSPYRTLESYGGIYIVNIFYDGDDYYASFSQEFI